MSKMRMFREEQILDSNFRKRVIQEITSNENVDRKNEALKRYEVYRDNTIKWVIKSLEDEGLKPTTLAQMSNRASNISIARKIINKLARCYSAGVQRESTQAQEKIDELTKIMNWNQKMKKSDKYNELHKNTLIQCIPELCAEESYESPKYELKLRNFQPWQYDAIEDANDHEKAACIILTDFLERDRNSSYRSQSDAGLHARESNPYDFGNRSDELIADSPEDQGAEQRYFIWWTNRYHFTTDQNGEYINEMSPEDKMNPVQMLPFANVVAEQDGEFWARGGQDIVDGSILVNKIITDRNAIAFIQGWGQPFITGVNIKDKIEGGPHNAIILEHAAGDPAPTFDYKTANPPLGDWREMIEQYIALLLSTNNLSPRNVAGNLNASDLPSGIALLIEQSEATGSVEDKQMMFQEVENRLWDVTVRWINLLFSKDALTDRFKEIGQLPELDMTIKFNSLKAPISEKEKLEEIKLRKELGINEMVDLILIDNPNMTRKDAEDKLKKIMQEKLKRMASMMEEGLVDAGNAGENEDGQDGQAEEPEEIDENKSRDNGLVE